jgi:hypothetical protein
MVLVETRVLGSNDSVLEVGRDLAEWNELVALVIGRSVHPGLHAALDMYRGCRWVDPSGRYKKQRGKRPKKDDEDEKPSDERAETTVATRAFIWHSGYGSG